jgi:transposase InsO family protein
MRIKPEVISKVIEIDKRYRYTWSLKAIGRITGTSVGSVAKIRRMVDGEKPKVSKRSHKCRTKFLKTDVMWSSDFMELPDKRELIKTIDETSRFRLGWDISKTATAESAVRHAENILHRMQKIPLIWKYDHGSAFTSGLFQEFLREHHILPYPIPPRSPWAQGRIERDNREIQMWLAPLKELTAEEWEREIDEGMFMLNFLKPREVLGFKTSAKVYFNSDGIESIDRCQFISDVEKMSEELDLNGEKKMRKAMRLIMLKWGLCQEWFEAHQGTEIVNTSHP